MKNTEHYTVFDGTNMICTGSLEEVVVKIKKRLGKSDHGNALIFSDLTGKTFDFNFSGTEKDVLKRLEVFVSKEAAVSTSIGRPKLGVMSREVSLLPIHWEWLATQPDGASSTIRKLIDEARKKNQSEKPTAKQIQEKIYRVMNVIAGDLPNYEEALRSLYRSDKKEFNKNIQTWPDDIREYLTRMSRSLFDVG